MRKKIYATQDAVGSSMLRIVPSRTFRAAAAPLKHDWGKTLNLPRSSFPARPTAAQLETYRQECADDLYVWQRASRSKQSDTGVDNEFVLHDGPPYANGAVHAGHALNKILKDIIVRSQLSRGKLVRYQPGWDCHGLPIELKALQARTDAGEQSKAQKEAGVGIPPAEVRQTASSLASKTIDEQRKEFRGWGVMGEWDAPYKTMDRDFEIRQLGVFREMVRKGISRPCIIYRIDRACIDVCGRSHLPRSSPCLLVAFVSDSIGRGRA